MVYVFGYMIEAVYLIVAFEFIGGLGVILGLYLYNKNKFTAFICEKYMGTFRVIKKMKVNITKQVFKWGKFEYSVNFSTAIIDNKNKPMIFYLVNGAKPIQVFNSKDIMIKEDSQTFKVAMDGTILQHMGNRKMDKMLLYVIIGMVIIIGIVAVYSNYNANETAKQIITLSRAFLNATKTQGGGIPIG